MNKLEGTLKATCQGPHTFKLLSKHHFVYRAPNTVYYETLKSICFFFNPWNYGLITNNS